MDYFPPRIGFRIDKNFAVLPLPQHFRECRYSWSHGSVGSPFCTDYINSVLPVPAKLPLLMGCADCTKIGSKIWSHGSVGRAHRSHRWGHRFESCCDHQNPRSKGLGFFFIPRICRVPRVRRVIRVRIGSFYRKTLPC